MFSVTTLTVIHEGVTKLARALAAGDSGITVTNQHANLFERLYRSFNNPNLLKEVGSVYLTQFRMPSVALRHLDLARQFAPKDRDVDRLQVAAALAVAQEMADQSGHSDPRRIGAFPARRWRGPPPRDPEDRCVRGAQSSRRDGGRIEAPARSLPGGCGSGAAGGRGAARRSGRGAPPGGDSHFTIQL